MLYFRTLCLVSLDAGETFGANLDRSWTEYRPHRVLSSVALAQAEEGFSSSAFYA